MPVDLDLIERHVSYDDPGSGVREEFVRPVLGGARTVAVLSRPVGESAPIGFVICPSFGPEHTQLNGLEVVVARAMAGAGFPVLRYHSQGYGDSEGTPEAITPASHLADAADAVRFLSERLDGLPVGTLGGLFGAVVAALTAEALALPAVGMWEPAPEGDRYAERLLRNLALQEIAAARNQDRPQPPLSVLRQRLVDPGVVDAQGFAFTRAADEELRTFSLPDRLASFRGASLVLVVSRSGRPGRTGLTLHEHLDRLGGQATLRSLHDKLVRPLGTYRFVGFPDRPGRLDTQFRLNSEIAAATVEWARSLPIGASG